MSATAVAQQEQDGAVAESEEAYAIETQIKAAMADGREALWRLAEALNAFDEMRGWLKLGHDNLSSWLADADVTLTRGTYYRLVRTWRKLVVERKIAPDRVRLLDQSKVAIVVDRITEGKVKVDDAFADVESLGASDLREKYYGPKPEKVEPAEEPANLANTQPETSGQKPEPFTAQEAEQTDGDDLQEIAGGEGDVADEDREVAKAEIARREAADGEGGAMDEGTARTGPGPEASEEPPPEDDPDFVPIEQLDADDTVEPGGEDPPAVQAMLEAESLPWLEIDQAYKSGAGFPRMPREAFGALLTWQKTHLG